MELLRIVDALLGRVDGEQPPHDRSGEHLPKRLRRFEAVAGRHRHPPGGDLDRVEFVEAVVAERLNRAREQEAQFLQRHGRGVVLGEVLLDEFGKSEPADPVPVRPHRPGAGMSLEPEHLTLLNHLDTPFGRIPEFRGRRRRRTAAGGVQAAAVVSAEIEITEQLGPETLAYFRVDGLEAVEIGERPVELAGALAARLDPGVPAEPGMRVPLEIDAAAVHLFAEDSGEALLTA